MRVETMADHGPLLRIAGRAMMKDADFLICLRIALAALGHLRMLPHDVETQFAFCRAVREAKLQLKSVLRDFGGAYGASRLLAASKKGVGLLPASARHTLVGHSIRRHFEEIKKALADCPKASHARVAAA